MLQLIRTHAQLCLDLWITQCGSVDTNRGADVRSMPFPYISSVTSTAMSTDGRIIVFGSSDNIIRVCNLTNGTVPLSGHLDEIASLRDKCERTLYCFWL